MLRLWSPVSRADSHLVNSEKRLTRERIALEFLRHNYVSQDNPFTVRDEISRCRRQQCSPNDFLTDARIRIMQPELKTVGAQHAYAKGLTGEGVTIAIEDDLVGFRLPEFEGRIVSEWLSADAVGYYLSPRDSLANHWDEWLEGGGNPPTFEDPGGDHDRMHLAAVKTIARYGWSDTWWALLREGSSPRRYRPVVRNSSWPIAGIFPWDHGGVGRGGPFVRDCARGNHPPDSQEFSRVLPARAMGRTT